MGALVLFCAVPLGGVFARPLAGRLVWNLVSLLPLVIVLLGYHRWRRVCPLYLLSCLPALARIRGNRRAPKWLEGNYYYVSFGLFAGSVWLRLTLMNGDGYAIAGYFVGITAAAAIISSIFTGRTWCNYFCPISFIEKVYTENGSFGKSSNSQCATCTACKTTCPDINQEKGYRKEMTLPAKRFVYFAFPGLVIGLYLYAYLQSGDWHSLFNGSAARHAGLFRSSFLPGHIPSTAGFFFLPKVPRAAAVALTLAGCCSGSFVIFQVAERLLGRARAAALSSGSGEAARHVLFTAAAFVAFVTFYAFVGPVMFGRTPWAVVAFELCVASLATVILVRRLDRAGQTGAVTLGRQLVPLTQIARRSSSAR